MEQKVLHQFIQRYFQANGADIITNDNKRLKVQLTEELDQLLMNRPFYWQYIKKTGGIPQPMTLTFITDGEKEKNEKAEYLHFGSPRLHQIFQSAKNLGNWTILYEENKEGQKPSPLFPWLVVNVKISYISYQRKDIIQSFGLQLIHGQIVNEMMERVSHKKLNNVIPAQTFPMHSLIQVNSGMQRIKRHIENNILHEPKEWADKAYHRMEEEIRILDAYYRSSSQPDEEYIQEKTAIMERYKPRIAVDIINSGLFYVGNSSFVNK
ncbi:YqhG family protein [Alteribacillus sp. JSM 102045]|uniref:YqhG family protein n=1 Tax=Alteribacillus sp. JSM 102045 TaxID=1562101 RepID=UPI0035BFBFE9